MPATPPLLRDVTTLVRDSGERVRLTYDGAQNVLTVHRGGEPSAPRPAAPPGAKVTDFDAYVAPSDRAVVNAGAVVAGVGIVVPELVKRIDPAAAWGGMELGLDLLLVGIGWALLTPGFGARAKQQRAQEELTRTLKLAVANATLGPHSRLALPR